MTKSKNSKSSATSITKIVSENQNSEIEAMQNLNALSHHAQSSLTPVSNRSSTQKDSIEELSTSNLMHTLQSIISNNTTPPKKRIRRKKLVTPIVVSESNTTLENVEHNRNRRTNTKISIPRKKAMKAANYEVVEVSRNILKDFEDMSQTPSWSTRVKRQISKNTRFL